MANRRTMKKHPLKVIQNNNLIPTATGGHITGLVIPYHFRLSDSSYTMSICETRTRSASQRHHGAWRRSWLGIAVLLVLASLTLPRGRALPVVLLQASEAPVQSASRLSLETVQAVVDAVAQKASVLAEQVYTIVAYDETGSAPSYAWTTKASLANLTATVRNPKRHLARRDIVTDPGAFGVGTNTTLRFAVGSSFIVDMQCAPSPTRNDASIMTAFCSEAYGSVHRAISRIAQTVDLTHPVWISMNVYSFCQQRLDMADPNASVAAVCDDVDSVLGSAGPTAWYAFSPQSAAALGVWSNVTYPSSLVRQHIPDDAVFGDSSFTSNNVVYDIVANFNADFAWWFPKNDDTDAGYADFINGFMGKLGRSSVPLPFPARVSQATMTWNKRWCTSLSTAWASLPRGIRI
ncbi:hypothetical protein CAUPRSCDRAFT_11461 [Caulochytrium protostelioides]|uniref:Uncharacterized protein n=1 Tax=Caulochytrium protostelioides TaxID=1555241 RepID=A0A4P9WU41_9FUNG|nr:hypothetical protein CAUPRSCDRAFT_11461 [Caulochytrium protostelioides]